MAYRLGDYVVYGELRNRHYMTWGIIVLRGEAAGEETVVRLELTGDCGPDLRGKAFRFSPDPAGPQPEVFPREHFSGLQPCQVGPTASMTADAWVRALPCTVEEFYQRAKLGEPPPTEWKRRLYLEWYSQNGRVLLEMAGPVIEQCVREADGEEDEGDWVPLPPPSRTPDQQPPTGPSFTIIRTDGDQSTIEHLTPGDLDSLGGNELRAPAALERQFEREAAQIDRAIRGDSEPPDDEALREAALMDYCFDYCEPQPVEALLEPAELPPPESLDDEQVETQLKVLLARLAITGIALDVCPHFTPRDCYRLLLSKVLPEEKAYKEVIGTGWVQHWSTWEYCKQCDDQFEQPESELPG
jgi:hypothetical protein